MDACRVVTAASSLTKSVSWYDAYTPKSGGGYERHAATYCDDGPKWAYTRHLRRGSTAEGFAVPQYTILTIALQQSYKNLMKLSRPVTTTLQPSYNAIAVVSQ